MECESKGKQVRVNKREDKNMSVVKKGKQVKGEKVKKRGLKYQQVIQVMSK